MCETLSVCTGDQPGERKPTHTSMLLWPQLNRHRLVSHSKQYWRSHFPAGLSASGSLFYSTIVLFYYGVQRAKCTTALGGSMRESPHSSFASDVSQERVETCFEWKSSAIFHIHNFFKSIFFGKSHGRLCPNSKWRLPVSQYWQETACSHSFETNDKTLKPVPNFLLHWHSTFYTSAVLDFVLAGDGLEYFLCKAWRVKGVSSAKN